MISGVLTVVLVFSALMLGGFTGAWAIWPTAYRHGYAEGESDRHRHRAGARQETTLLELPRAGRLPVERLADPEPLPGEPPWVFAGGWDQGPVAELAEHDLLTQTADCPDCGHKTCICGPGPEDYELMAQTAEQPVAGVDTPSDFIEGMTETVNAMISEWVAQGNVDRHTIQAGD